MLFLELLECMTIFTNITDDPSLNNRTVYRLIENQLNLLENETEHREWLDENGHFIRKFRFFYIVEPSYFNPYPEPKISSLFQFTARYGFFDIFKCMIENKAIVEGITTKEAAIEVLKERDHKSFTPLHFAVERGHLNTVKYLIEEIKVVSIVTDMLKNTLLHIAAANHRLNIVKYFVDLKNSSFDDINTVGHVEYANIDLPRYFDKKGANLTAPGESRDKLMQLAAIHDKLDAMMHRIEVDHQDPNICDIDGYCALHYAAAFGQTDIVIYLIAHNANVDQRTRDGRTALHLAAERGHLDILKHLVVESENIYSVDENNNTILHIAINTSYGHFLDIVRYLVNDVEMSIYLRNNLGATPFHISANKVFYEILDFFIEEKDADLTRVDNNGLTTLHYAILAKSRCNIDIIKYIVSKKVDVNVQDRDGKTALHHSVEMQSLSYVKYFIEETKAIVKATDNKRRSILHYACYNHAVDIVKYLIGLKRIHVSTVDYERKTCLHLSLERGPANLELIKYLVQNGATADIHRKDKHGVTPMGLVYKTLSRADSEERGNYRKIVEYFNDVETCA